MGRGGGGDSGMGDIHDVNTRPGVPDRDGGCVLTGPHPPASVTSSRYTSGTCGEEVDGGTAETINL